MTTRGRPVRRIVVGLDGSEQAKAALSFAIDIARATGARITAVYAVAPPTYVYGYPDTVPVQYDPEWRAQIELAFRMEWCRPLYEQGIEFDAVMEEGRPAAVVVAVADREDADLVVVGRRGRGGMAELLLGSVSHEVSHHCRRPVLLVSRPQAPVSRERTAAEPVAMG